jgi:general secretion pathway protein M
MKLPAQLKKLNKRERYAIIGAVGVISIFLFFTFIVEPFFNRTNRLKRNLQTKAAMVEQMRQLQAEYISLTQKEKISKARYLRREKGFKLYPFLNQLAGKAGIQKDRIIYMKPTTKAQKDSPYKISRVEMKLEAITLEQLTTYLHGVETSRNMVEVKKISISKKDKKQGQITAVLQVETVEI